MNDAGDRLTYSVAEAARVLGISRSYCYELVQQGVLPSLRLGRRRLVPRAAQLSSSAKPTRSCAATSPSGGQARLPRALSARACGFRRSTSSTLFGTLDRLPVPPEAELGRYQGRSVILGIRPSDFEDAAVWHDERRPIIEVTEDLGSEVHVLFTVQAPPVGVEGVQGDPEAEGAPIPLVAPEVISAGRISRNGRPPRHAGTGTEHGVRLNPVRPHHA